MRRIKWMAVWGCAVALAGCQGAQPPAAPVMKPMPASAAGAGAAAGAAKPSPTYTDATMASIDKPSAAPQPAPAPKPPVLVGAAKPSDHIGWGMAPKPTGHFGGGGDQIPGQDFTTVQVFYGTDRKRTETQVAAQIYGSERASGITYGVCNVSIPRSHQPGALESPSVWKFEFKPDPEKHVILQAVELRQKKQFFDELAARVQNDTHKKTFLFVHGYNVTFADAARRTAQIAYDLNFSGAPVFYSWASRGDVKEYMADEATVEWSTSKLKYFLIDFLQKSQAEHVYLIAHSMGNRALTRAVMEVYRDVPEVAQHLQEVILAAPDIDAMVFRDEIAPALKSGGKPVTLYASSKDKALKASKEVHGDMSRAGDSSSGALVTPGVEGIDASGVDTDFLGHGYLAQSREVLDDLLKLIQDGLHAGKRDGLLPVTTERGTYWVFK